MSEKKKYPAASAESYLRRVLIVNPIPASSGGEILPAP